MNDLQYYFSKSGKYGPRSEMTKETEWQMIIPTWAYFTPEVWELIEAADDSARYELARHFSIGPGVHRYTARKCTTCGIGEPKLITEETENDNA